MFSAYELWFKQIIYEIDSIRDIFMGSEKLQQFSLMSLTAETLKPEAPSLDERVMLDINKRFETLRKYVIYYLLVTWSNTQSSIYECWIYFTKISLFTFKQDFLMKVNRYIGIFLSILLPKYVWAHQNKQKISGCVDSGLDLMNIVLNTF